MSKKKCGPGCPQSGIRDFGKSEKISPKTQNRTCLTEQKYQTENDRLMHRMDQLFRQADDELQRIWCLDSKLGQLNRKLDFLTNKLTGSVTRQFDLEQNYALTSTGLDFSNNEVEAVIAQPPPGASAGTPSTSSDLAPPRPPRWSDNAAATAPRAANAVVGYSDRFSDRAPFGQPRPLSERQLHYQHHHHWQLQQQQQRTPTPTASTYAQDYIQRVDLPPPPLLQQQQLQQHQWLLPLPPPLKLCASRREADDAPPRLYWN